MNYKIKINWRKQKVIAFESDDWGGPDRFGFPDLATYQKGLDNAHITRTRNRSPLWFMSYENKDSLESIDDMDALFKLLSAFHGGDGRPVVFTPVYFLANPDFDAIRANGFTKYIDIGIDKEYPKIWRDRGDIIAKAREGMELGVWFPESHNTRAAGHFDPHKWVQMLRDKKDLALNAFFELNMIGKPSEPTTNVGKEFDSMGLEELEEWIQVGTQYFRNAFGYSPRVSGTSDARSTCKVLGDVMEKLLVKNGVTAIFNANHKEMGEYNSKTGLTYTKRNANFEPVMARLTKDQSGTWRESENQEPWSASCYREILTAWENNQPAIVNSHRVNYSSLDSEKKAKILKQLELLLEKIKQEHPEAVYRSSYEISQLYRGEIEI